MRIKKNVHLSNHSISDTRDDRHGDSGVEPITKYHLPEGRIMSHNLASINGQTALFFNQQNHNGNGKIENGVWKPWHNLGTAVDGALTWQDAMQKAGLNWSVSKRQLSALVQGNYSPVDAWGIFRDDNDTFLGAVGDKYTTIQNQDAFDFVDTLLETSGAHYDTAGALGNGERIFVSATIPYSIAPDRAPQDKTNCYLMFETSHDGSLSATAKLTTVRVICQNTLSQALSDAGMGSLKVRHTENGQGKLDRAKRMFTGVVQSVETLKKKFDLLSGKKPGKTEMRATFDRLFGHDWAESPVKRNQIERITSLWANNDNNAFPEIKGSAYALLQSVTNWVDHERTCRKTERMNHMSESAVRTQAAIFNGGDALKQTALEIILEETANCATMPTTQYFNAPKSSAIETILANVSL
jgi:phage/plasmid-like protein (TIGR03299 family)